MIRHVSLLTFVEGTVDAQVRAVEDALAELPARLPQLQAYTVARDLGLAGTNASLAVVADFATVDDFLAYRDDAQHRRILAELITPILAGRTAAQFETSSPP